eukprot:scaffold508_cov60-Isochrysis_galbana.AAC.1
MRYRRGGAPSAAPPVDAAAHGDETITGRAATGRGHNVGGAAAAVHTAAVHTLPAGVAAEEASTAAVAGRVGASGAAAGAGCAFDSHPRASVPPLALSDAAADAFDALASHTLFIGLSPLIVGWAVYCLVYYPHPTWYSWALSSMADSIYLFGFIGMTPQVGRHRLIFPQHSPPLITHPFYCLV